MANQLTLGRALDQNGYIAPGSKATVYLTGTSTLIDVWTDADGSIAAANPIIADGNGYWPQRFVSQTARVVITDADDVTLQTLDPAPTSIGTGSAASEVSVTPSVAVPFTDVQSALEGVATSVVSGVSAFGVGITGNAGLLANLNATNIAAGVYRFDGTTTGTYPTGVVADDTGMIETWRQSSTVAMMELHHATSSRVFRRRLTAGAWGAWREAINVNQATAEGDIAYRGASDWVRLPKGTAGQALVMNAGATAPEWATGFTARAWGNINGSTVAFRASGNCASVTRPATGIFEVTLTTAMPDANYAIVVSGTQGEGEAAGDLNDFYTARAVSASVLRVRCYDTSGAAVNPSTISFAVFR